MDEYIRTAAIFHWYLHHPDWIHWHHDRGVPGLRIGFDGKRLPFIRRMYTTPCICIKKST